MKIILSLLSNFLKEKKLSDGGYAPVSKEDEEELSKIFYKIITAKWGKDPDGDYPIEFSITNRHKYERKSFVNLPYEHKAKNEKEFDRTFQIAMCNLSIAMRKVENLMDDKRLNDKEKRFKKEST